MIKLKSILLAHLSETFLTTEKLGKAGQSKKSKTK